jgi:hypothetical protein
MPREYTTFDIAAMSELLTPDKGWAAVHGYRELVLEWKFRKYPGVVLRVYTSIDRETGFAREKGSDAIRVCAVNLTTKKGLVKAKRVLRVTNWRVNLKRRIWEVMNVVRTMRGDAPLPQPKEEKKKDDDRRPRARSYLQG